MLMLMAVLTAITIPVEFHDNTVFVPVAINSSAPRWFILDSGAGGCVIDLALARSLGLRMEGEARGTGAGKGTYAVTFTADVTYHLDGATFKVPKTQVIDLSSQPALFGRRVAGILGYEFFNQYVVEVDYESELMTLYDPETYKRNENGAEIPFTLSSRTPHVRMRIGIADREPVERELLVDSGSGDALDDDTLGGSPQTLKIVGGVGLGQEFEMTLGRAQFLELGPFRLEAPAGVTGGVPLIGNEILRRFNVTFDYKRSRLYLEANSHLRDPFVVDASGLSIRWAPDLDRFLVHDVVAASPASEAGFRTGDAIVAIDDQPADRFRIGQVRTMLRRAGTTHRFTVVRGQQTASLTMRTRRRL